MEKSAVRVVNSALPFICAFWNCSNLWSNNMQCFNSVWYDNVDRSCNLILSLAF